MDRTSAGGGDSWWSYTLAGRAEGEDWFPRFFYHGSRYLQVERSAPPGAALPEVERLESVVVHSDSPPAGEFASSSELFNRIRGLIRWAQRSNLAHVITDCPHRERLGWLEQYHLNGPSLRYETDLTRLFAKTFLDMADAQQPSGLVPDIAPEYVVFEKGFRDSPEWGSAIVLAAWQHYVWTGDDTPLRRNYDGDEALRRLPGQPGRGRHRGPRARRLVRPRPRRARRIRSSRRSRSPLPRSRSRTTRPVEDRPPAGPGRRCGEIRRGRGPDQERVQPAVPRHVTVRSMPPARRRPRPCRWSWVSSRRSIARACSTRSSATCGAIAAPTAGDVGYRYVLRALADGGRSDVIFEMNHQSERPGYGYQLARGATSLTEAWDANPRSSQNHFMLGQIIEWFYGDLAGLAPDPAFPGFKRVRIRPQPGGRHRLGPGRSRRRREDASRWSGAATRACSPSMSICRRTRRPRCGCRRRTWAPCAKGAAPPDHAPGVRLLRQEGDRAVFAVDSGRYAFSSPLEVHR